MRHVYVSQLFPFWLIRPAQSLTVPVNIRVTDANDNSPVFRSATYHVSISEAGSLVISFTYPAAFFHFIRTGLCHAISGSCSLAIFIMETGDRGGVRRFGGRSSARRRPAGPVLDRALLDPAGTLLSISYMHCAFVLIAQLG